jgi:hypothetical protein
MKIQAVGMILCIFQWNIPDMARAGKAVAEFCWPFCMRPIVEGVVRETAALFRGSGRREA